MKVIIIGGVAGGASAAARLRRLNEKADITIYERSGYISYANCGLPYYIGGVIKDKAELTLQSPESFYKRFRINVKVNHEVIAIDTAKKIVTIQNVNTKEIFQDSYDKLLLSPGAKAVKPNICGIDHNGIFSLRTVEDCFKINQHIKSQNSKSAIIIGGGFVGLEMAENLKSLGLSVTIVESANQVLSTVDNDMAVQIHALLRKNAINLILNTRVTAFERHNNQITCLLDDGKKVSAEIILLAMGVMPDTKLAVDAGLKLGAKGGIIVNSKMETSIPDIYAVGDAIIVEHYVTGEKRLVSLAGPANKQGRIAADNIAGKNSYYKGSQGTSIIKLFDISIATTGISERFAKDAGLSYEKIIISPTSYASYYPNATVMTLKMLFEKKSNRILGAQIIGYCGVDKRIDVIATAIRAGLKANELAELELAYAPPYSSAKDPVNMAGFVAENIILGKIKQFYYEDIAKLLKDETVVLLDTRTDFEYSKGHIDGFINIPVDNLRERLLEIPKEKPVYIMCQSGIRSYIACCILMANGYDCYNFAGGYRFYSVVESEKLVSSACYSCGACK